MSQNCLLGVDFLKQNGCIVDLADGMLRCGGGTTPLRYQTQAPSVCRVAIEKNIALEPNKEAVLTARLSSTDSVGVAGVFEPRPGFEAKHQVLMARVVARPTPTGQVPLRVVNLSADRINLYGGQHVGSFCPMAGTCDVVSAPVGAYVEICQVRPCSTQEKPEQEHCNLSCPQPSGVERLKAELELEKLPLNPDERHNVEKVVEDYADVFSVSGSPLGKTDVVYHRIDTGDSPPIRQHPRRLSPNHREEVENLIQGMLEKGVVQPSHSPWASPIVLVQKKDGSTRMCVDYRKINNVTKKDSFPLSRVDDILDALGGALWLSTLDLVSGYWQVEVYPEDREKTAFVVPHGLYEFRTMPFGLCNAPSTFQRLMELVLAGLRWEICLAYLDDIVIFGSTFEEHLERLRTVLDRLRASGLRLKPSKCQLFRREVRFLGHVVTKDGVAADPEKTEGVRTWPQPTNATELRSFLGLASYYRRFVRDFGTIAAPLSLTEKGATFIWTEQADAAFKELRN